MKRIVTFIMAVIMIATLANPSTVDAATNAKLSKTKVTLSITDKKKNPSVTLKVKKASKRAMKKAKWTTSNKKVASVSKKGKITAKKTGKATITCKVSGKKLKCRVTVVDKRKAKTSDDGDEVMDEPWTDLFNQDTYTTPGCSKGGVHRWVKHWASYDTSGSYAQTEVVDGHVYDCNCGLFLSEEEKMAHWMEYLAKFNSYESDDVRNLMGLHGIWAHGSRTEEKKWVDSSLMTYWTLHMDYVDYMDCTKCGKRLMAYDLPEGYGI